MYATALLVAEFDQLTAPLMMSGADLPRSIRTLEQMARSAVGSLLGWTLSVKVDDNEVTMTSLNPLAVAGDIRASLRVPLTAFATSGLDGVMVFYATKPYAFCHLAADFMAELGAGTSLLRTDQDLNPSLAPGLRGVREMTSINQAIGILMAGGDSADTARQRLQKAAKSAHLTLRQSARALLDAPGSVQVGLA